MSSLPLLTRAAEHGSTFALTKRAGSHPPLGLLAPLPVPQPGRMPTRAPGPNEQYGFHFDIRKC